MEFSFPYKTSVEELDFGSLPLRIERLFSLDQTIDEFFAEYERTGRTELFEDLCPYFGVPWPAGKRLAELAFREADRWKGIEVLELGCGLALPSLVLAKLGCRVTATDLHPDVPVFLERNRARNEIPRLEFRFTDWRKDRLHSAPEVILASDVLYDRITPKLLAEFLKNQKSWREFWLTDPGRPYYEAFSNLVKLEGWSVEEQLEQGIFRITLKR